MPTTNELNEFRNKHSWPEAEGISSLYRFYRVNDQNIEFHKDLFVDRKLYHSLPSSFNDPFECKPHFRWPSCPKKVKKIRNGIFRVSRRNGLSKKEADSMVSRSMINTALVENAIYAAIHRGFGGMRLCCFTKSKDNLLFWSHYADSHKGFCVEFDATILPIKFAFKVSYQDEYPEAEYPRPNDERGLLPH